MKKVSGGSRDRKKEALKLPTYILAELPDSRVPKVMGDPVLFSIKEKGRGKPVFLYPQTLQEGPLPRIDHRNGQRKYYPNIGLSRLILLALLVDKNKEHLPKSQTIN